MTSQDGEKFYTHEKSEYCSKCGDRVLACPHLYLDSKPFALPPKTSFLKLQRPILKLRSHAYSLSDTTPEAKTEDEDITIPPNFFKIWKNFYDKRGGGKPITKREFSLNKISAIMQELYATKWAWDQASPKDEDAESLQVRAFWLRIGCLLYLNVGFFLSLFARSLHLQKHIPQSRTRSFYFSSVSR